MASAALLTAAIPFVVDNVALFLTLRVLSGFAQGIVTPCVYQMLGVWTPRQEKSLVYCSPFPHCLSLRVSSPFSSANFAASTIYNLEFIAFVGWPLSARARAGATLPQTCAFPLLPWSLSMPLNDLSLNIGNIPRNNISFRMGCDLLGRGYLCHGLDYPLSSSHWPRP